MKLNQDKLELTQADSNKVIQASIELIFDDSENIAPSDIYNLMFPLLSEMHNEKQIKVEIGTNGIGTTNPNDDNAIRLRLHTDFGLYQITIAQSFILFSCHGKYFGWEKYFGLFNKFLEYFAPNKAIRFGVRYMSRFEPFALLNKENTTVDITINNESILSNGQVNHITHSFLYNEYNCILQMANLAQIDALTEDQISQGSMLDVDVNKLIKNNSVSDLKAMIEEAHKISKNMVKSVLTDKFIEKLNNGQ